MKNHFSVLLLSLLAMGHCAYGKQASLESFAFTHINVIDGTGSSLQKDMTVVISGDRIARIVPNAQAHLAKNIRQIDAKGKFLIPGLWDMHVHWYYKKYLPLFTVNGITGIRIMFGNPRHFEWRQELEKGILVGPRMNIGSPLLDGPNASYPGSIVVANEQEAREAVRQIQKDGYDFVKVYSKLSRASYFGAADECRKLNFPFEGHVPDSIRADEASEAGQRTTEHLRGVALACSTLAHANQNVREADAARAYDEETAAKLFEEFRRNHTWQCPTLDLTTRYAIALHWKEDPRNKYMPPSAIKLWEGMMPDPAAEAEHSADAELVRKTRFKIVGDMERAGVGILAGTDCLNPLIYPGYSLHEELALLVEAGLTPMQALQAATINPARFLGTEKDLGTIEAGKLADLVLLRANPLEDIHNTTSISAVVQNGRLFPGLELQNLLSNVAAAASRSEDERVDIH